MGYNLAAGGTRGSVKRASGPSSIMRPGNKAEPSSSEITYISGRNAISAGAIAASVLAQSLTLYVNRRGCHIFSCNKNNKRQSDGHEGRRDIPLNVGWGEERKNERHFLFFEGCVG